VEKFGEFGESSAIRQTKNKFLLTIITFWLNLFIRQTFFAKCSKWVNSPNFIPTKLSCYTVFEKSFKGKTFTDFMVLLLSWKFCYEKVPNLRKCDVIMSMQSQKFLHNIFILWEHKTFLPWDFLYAVFHDLVILFCQFKHHFPVLSHVLLFIALKNGKFLSHMSKIWHNKRPSLRSQVTYACNYYAWLAV